MPNVMVAPPQSLADAHYLLPCSNAAKTRKPLKVAGVPQTPETISAATVSYTHLTLPTNREV